MENSNKTKFNHHVRIHGRENYMRHYRACYTIELHNSQKTGKIILFVLHNMMAKNILYKFKKIENYRIKSNSWFLFRF